MTSENTPRTKMVDARNNLGLSPKELANLVGVSRAYIVNIEAGRYTPSLDVAYKIASILKKTIEEIFFDFYVHKTNDISA